MLLLLAALLAGVCFFLGKYFINGAKWASFYANDSIYTNGVLTAGTIYDRNGVALSYAQNGVRCYPDDEETRLATLHAIGDTSGNIGTGALDRFAYLLTGYNLFTGTHTLGGKGNSLYLSIDSKLNKTAFDALAGRNGTVAVCNYETGEILCMVSTPSFDPNGDGSDVAEGAYLNKFLSSTYTPGSIFKLVTLTAAIENIPDLENWTYTCEGSSEIGGDTITCTEAHGTENIEEALANSCNCAFAKLAEELGPELLDRYSQKLGVTASFSINGIATAKGNFEEAEAGTSNLAWSAIGQYTDLVCPAAYLRLMCAFANGGEAKSLTMISKVKDSLGISVPDGFSSVTENLLSSATADKIKDMMSYDVYYKYGEDNFPGLDLCAKSGTAEVGEGQEPTAWFVGFLTSEDAPLAFVVVVENGGYGSEAAGSVANTVLQAAVSAGE